MKTKRCTAPFRQAFTLVELLVTLTVIFLFAVMMLPALASSKMKSTAAGCLSNLRQLQNGWSIFLNENNDLMMPNSPSPSTSSWVIGSEGWGVVDANTNTLYYTSSLIASYIGNNISLLKCPADVVPSANGQRLRSYSMNGQMGYLTTNLNYNPTFRTYVHGYDLNCPSPANAFIFLDEHPASLNDGNFQLGLATPSLPSIPANYIEGGGGFSFADGHAVIHQWQTSSFMFPVVNNAGQANIALSSSNPDWLWLTNHAACQQ